MSGCPTRKPSARPTSSTSSPVASIARRAARTRSTAASRSNSGPRRRAERAGVLQPRADGILDGKARDPALHREAHALGHARGIGAETVLEVRVERHIDSRRQIAQMREDLGARRRVVGTAPRPGEARARARECLEAETLQIQGAADVPGVRDREAAAFVELAECAALFRGARARLPRRLGLRLTGWRQTHRDLS